MEITTDRYLIITYWLSSIRNARCTVLLFVHRNVVILHHVRISSAAREAERRIISQHDDQSAGGDQHVFAGRRRIGSASQYQQGSSIAAIANRRHHQQEQRQHRRRQAPVRTGGSFRHDDRSRSVVATLVAFNRTTRGPAAFHCCSCLRTVHTGVRAAPLDADTGRKPPLKVDRR